MEIQNKQDVKDNPANESEKFVALKEIAIITLLGFSSIYLAKSMNNGSTLIGKSNMKGLAY